MPLMAWRDDYSVKVGIIDQQHKKLINLLNDLFDGLREQKGKEVVGRILGDLVTYTEVHFATEERLMKTHGYAGYPQHKVEHETLTKKVVDFHQEFTAGRASIPVELIQFLRDWLSNHILVSDKNYTPFFQSKGVQ
ncbi:MAG TPA: bacteriohemerythrin [Bacteroidota bacterium]|nr:bacteriohemerythrin [Bacteroidota bacterium]